MTPGGTITSKKSIKQSNPARQAKRDKAYRAGLAVSRKAPGYTVARARSGGQCEAVHGPGYTIHGYSYEEFARDGIEIGAFERCEWRETKHRKLHGHHKTYARFPGNELPTDYAFVCPGDHERLEALKPMRRVRRSEWSR